MFSCVSVPKEMDRQDKEKIRAELKAIRVEGRRAFKGGYSTQLKELEELSRADVDKKQC